MPDPEEIAPGGADADGVQDPPQVEETQDLEEEEREPGGNSPEQVRARKEYRLRKKTESALQVEREKAIALEARVQTLQDVATRKVDSAPTPEKRLTSAEAWQKVDLGEWTRETATEYIADTRYAENRNREKAEERAAHEILEPVQEARKEALEYVKLVPSLANQTHPKWGEIVQSVEFHLRADPRITKVQAERLALREILGPIERVREKQKVNSARPSGDPHTETRGGGGGGPIPNKKDAFPDIPAHVKELWDKFGTSEKDRVIEAKYYRENRPNRGR